MKIENLSLSFILDKVTLNWAEVLWGYEQGYLSWSSIIQLAEQRLTEGSENPSEIELASFTKEQASQVNDRLRDFVGTIPSDSQEQIKKKWLFLVLAWVYEKRTNFPEPLETVEIIYSDFDYPEEISNFVRYMPPLDGYDPSKYTREENVGRLYKKWAQYLSDTEKAFKTSQIVKD